MKFIIIIIFISVPYIKGFAQFGPQQIISTEVFGTNSVISADIDGDNDMDVITEGHIVAWYENLNGFGDFGEQQMIAMGRALMSRPKLILLDEPSMGLAPQLVEEIFAIVKNLNKEGVSFLIAEQNAMVALKYADEGYLIENGRVILKGQAKELLERPDVKEMYLGVGAEGQTSFRDIKYYHRRKPSFS